MIVDGLEITATEEKYLDTIKELRLKNFSKNLPFLMLSDKLPGGQVYREFVDGRIELQEVVTIGSTYSSNVLRVLTDAEADKVRREHGLF